jgi:ribosomal-protein-alanine N-acetyltransferase
MDEHRILETERLVLRKLTLEDLDALAELYRDPEVRRFFPDGTRTREETLEELEWIIDVYYGRHGFGLWATLLKESGEFVGRCGLIPWTIEGRDEVEVAYLLGRPHWGQGLATEAARAVVTHAFTELRLPRLICLIDPANAASKAVAVKIGMSFERKVLDEYGESLLYSSPAP